MSYPILRLRLYKSYFHHGGIEFKLPNEFQDIHVDRDEVGNLMLYNGKPRYSMDPDHTFCYNVRANGRGSWVVGHFYLDRNNAMNVSACECRPDNEAQEMHGDFPPEGRWREYSTRYRHARWHVEKVWAEDKNPPWCRAS